MLTIIIVLAILFAVFEIGASLLKVAKSFLEILAPLVGIIILLALVINFIDAYGKTVIKVIAFGLGLLSVIAVASLFYKIVLSAIGKKEYVRLLDFVGISENSNASASAKTRERVIAKGLALRLNSEYTASARFYRAVEAEVLQKKFFTISDLTAIVKVNSNASPSSDGVFALMVHLAKKNSLLLLDPSDPATPAVSECCCLQNESVRTLVDIVRKQGLMDKTQFANKVFQADPSFQAVTWLPLAFLQLLVQLGEVEKAADTKQGRLYAVKGFENLNCEATSTEISL